MSARSLPFALLLAVSMALPAVGRAEKRKEAPPPPPALPVPQEIQVMRGEEREIFLRVYGRKNQAISFLIRKSPRSGQLSPPTNTEAEVAVVRYRPADDRKITRDSFKYAARSNEGISAAVVVDIKIVDLPAQLSVAPDTTFQQRLTGTEEIQVVEVENQGGTAAEGEAFVDSPWKIEGRSTYSIEPHGRGFLRIKFAPVKSGQFTGEVRFSSQPDRVTTLRGTAVDPIEVRPALLALQPELTTLVRAAAVELTNHTETPLTVRASATEPLLVDLEIALGPGETRPAVIRTPSGEAFQLNGKVTFEAGAFRSEVAVTAEALPAVIRPAEPVLNFGQLPVGPNPQFELVLHNVGGRSGTATVVANGPLNAPTQAVSIPPGETARVPITLASGTTGTVEASLEIRSETGVRRVPVRGGVGVKVPRIAAAAPPVSKQGSKKKTSTAVHEPLAWSPYETDVMQPVDQRKLVRVAALESRRCSLEWSKELSKAAGFIAEIRQLIFVEGQLVQKWRPHPAFRVEKEGARIKGTLEGIEPGKLYTVRVRAQEPGSAPGPVVFQMAFSTPVPQKSSWGVGWKTALLAFACIWVAVFYWKRRDNAPAPTSSFDARKTQKIFD